MANVLVDEQSLSDIADAIRAKKSVTDTYKPSEMADAVRSIQGGGGYPEPVGTIEITENGTYDVKDKAEAVVEVQGDQYVALNKYINSEHFDIFTSNTENIVTRGLSYINAETLYFPALKSFQDESLANTTAKRIIILGEITTLGRYSLRFNTELKCCYLPYLKTSTNVNGTLGNANALLFLNIGNATLLGRFTLETQERFKTLVCPKSSLIPMESTAAITAINGYIYVPDNLIDIYKGATNWSNFADNIKGFSEAPDYNSDTIYTIGDVCKHNGRFYSWCSLTDGNSEPVIKDFEITDDWFNDAII